MIIISNYKTIAVINEPHKIHLVQNIDTGKIYAKKVLDVYNIDVYNFLYQTPVIGTPRIIDYVQTDSTLTIVEEYISGESLQEKIENCSLSVNEITNLMVDLCDTLSRLHSMNPPIIHRDIKPSNVIISSCGHAVLIDFNAAKYFSAESEKDTVLLGTQGYAAPEQYISPIFLLRCHRYSGNFTKFYKFQRKLHTKNAYNIIFDIVHVFQISICVAKLPLHNLTILLIKRNPIPNNLLHTLVFSKSVSIVSFLDSIILILKSIIFQLEVSLYPYQSLTSHITSVYTTASIKILSPYFTSVTPTFLFLLKLNVSIYPLFK